MYYEIFLNKNELKIVFLFRNKCEYELNEKERIF